MLIFFVLLFCEVSAQGEQVSNYFLDHLLKVSKSQIIFLTICSSWASLKIFFWLFAQAEQVSILFFGVCSKWADTQFYFLKLAQGEQASNFIFWSLLKMSRCPILSFEVCSSGMVGAVPVCPPERPCSGVSIPKWHDSTCKQHVSTREWGAAMCKQPVSTNPLGTANDGCALAGRAGRHIGTATTLALTSFPIVLSSFNYLLPDGHCYWKPGDLKNLLTQQNWWTSNRMYHGCYLIMLTNSSHRLPPCTVNHWVPAYLKLENK